VALIDEHTPLSTLSSGIEDRLDQFKVRIQAHWAVICRHDPWLHGHSTIDSIDFEEGEVVLNTQYCEPGYNQWYDHEVRIDFQDLDLTLEEFEAKIVEGHQRRKEANEAREREKKRQEQEEYDRQDRQTFERLKEKFESGE